MQDAQPGRGSGRNQTPKRIRSVKEFCTRTQRLIPTKSKQGRVLGAGTKAGILIREGDTYKLNPSLVVTEEHCKYLAEQIIKNP